MWLEVYYETVNSKGQIDLMDELFLLLFFNFWTELSCSTSHSLIVAQPPGNKEAEQIYSQVEVIKPKRVKIFEYCIHLRWVINLSLQKPKGKKVLECKAKPKNGKKISKAHDPMKNKSAKVTPITENVLTTQTENEGML